MVGRQWVIYILENEAGFYYTGITTDVERRVRQHNGELSGGGKYTKKGRPWKVVYTEQAPDMSDALKREHQIKQMSKAGKVALVDRSKNYR